MLIGLSVSGREWGGKQSWMLDVALDLKAAGHGVDVLVEPASALFHRASAAGLSPIAFDFAIDGGESANPSVVDWNLALSSGRRDAAVIAALVAAAPCRVPHVTMRHSPFPLDLEDPMTISMLRGLAGLILTSRVLRNGQGERLTSQGLIEPGRIHVMRSGVRSGRWLPPPAAPSGTPETERKASTPVIGTVGRLSWEKGQRILLQAVAQLVDSHPDVQLVVVGDGPERSSLERLADGLRIANRVTFTGFRSDVAELLSGFDIFALPSIAGETGPLALKEAMAMALPVVASRLGGIPELVTDGATGLLVDAGNPRQLSRALASLLTEPDRARALGQAGRAYVSTEYNGDRMSADLVALLERIAVDEGPASRVCGNLRWSDSARLRQEEFGGLVFVPATSQVVQLSEADYLAVASLRSAPDANPAIAPDTSPKLVRHLYQAGALKMNREGSSTR